MSDTMEELARAARRLIYEWWPRWEEICEARLESGYFEIYPEGANGYELNFFRTVGQDFSFSSFHGTPACEEWGLAQNKLCRRFPHACAEAAASRWRQNIDRPSFHDLASVMEENTDE